MFDPGVFLLFWTYKWSEEKKKCNLHFQEEVEVGRSSKQTIATRKNQQAMHINIEETEAKRG